MIIEICISAFMMNGKFNHLVVASDITSIIYNWFDKSRKCKYELWADLGILVRGGGLFFTKAWGLGVALMPPVGPEFKWFQ